MRLAYLDGITGSALLFMAGVGSVYSAVAHDYSLGDFAFALFCAAVVGVPATRLSVNLVRYQLAAPVREAELVDAEHRAVRRRLARLAAVIVALGLLVGFRSTSLVGMVGLVGGGVAFLFRTKHVKDWEDLHEVDVLIAGTRGRLSHSPRR